MRDFIVVGAIIVTLAAFFCQPSIWTIIMLLALPGFLGGLLD